ncbi:hypothetical protein G6F57_020005 [Rhizopus arrhizus]|nr:hypothetical protein G6F57_020005 [Rhizopus arrhizus]
MADQWSCGDRWCVPDHPGLGPAADQHADPAHFRRDPDHRPSRTAGRQPPPAADLAGPDRCARSRLPDPAGRGIHPRLQGTEPDAGLGHLRVDVLHADRLPRVPRDPGRHHADRHPDPPDPGPFHRRPPLRF